MVEMVVAMAVGLFLVGGILQVLMSSRASYRLAEAQSRVQENGRYAAQLLAKDLRGSRSSGCRSIALEDARKTLAVEACGLLDPTGNDACAGNSVLGSGKPLGYDATQQVSEPTKWLAGLPGNMSAGGAEQTVKSQWLRGDVLVSWGTLGEGVYVQSPGSLEVVDGSGNLAFTGTVDLVGANEDLVGGRLALVTDCEASDVFTITNARTNQQTQMSLPTKLQHAESYDADGTPPEPSVAGATPSYTDKSAYKVNTRTDLARAYNRRGTDTSPGTSIRARVFPFEYRVYYICCMDTGTGEIQENNARGHCAASPARYRPALCRWSTTDGAQQFVSDVADMRVTYDGELDASVEKAKSGSFNSASTKRFSDMSDIADALWVDGRGYWGKVDSARVELLATSTDEVRPTTASPVAASNSNNIGYQLGADRRLYQVFDITVATRASSPWYLRQ